MAIEIPHEVALFLNFCGIPDTDINKDHTPSLRRAPDPLSPLRRGGCANSCTRNLTAYLAFEVISQAIEPLEHTIGRILERVVYDSAVPPLHIEPDEVLRVLDDHADELG